MRMFKFIVLLTCLTSYFNFEPAIANEIITPTEFASHPVEIERVISKIYNFPEAIQLLKTASKQGAIHVKFLKNSPHEVFWDSFNRTIFINPEKHQTPGQYISSIIFELHNAVADEELSGVSELAFYRKLDKEMYVRKIEQIEHNNAIRACALLDKGIAENFFPHDAYWTVFNNFEDHYQVQQLTGHSQIIASSYDGMNPRYKQRFYHGTLGKYRYLNEELKTDYMRYLSIKDDLNSKDRDRIAMATKYLKEEYSMLKNCINKTNRKRCKSSIAKLNILNDLFQQNAVFKLMNL